jgi:hypothetical protein
LWTIRATHGSRKVCSWVMMALAAVEDKAAQVLTYVLTGVMRCQALANYAGYWTEEVPSVKRVFADAVGVNTQPSRSVHIVT